MVADMIMTIAVGIFLGWMLIITAEYWLPVVFWLMTLIFWLGVGALVWFVVIPMI